MYYKITEKGGPNFLIRGSRQSYKKVFTEQHIGLYQAREGRRVQTEEMAWEKQRCESRTCKLAVYDQAEGCVLRFMGSKAK